MDKMIEKVKRFLGIYSSYIENEFGVLKAEIFETKEHYTSPLQIKYNKTIHCGDTWGEKFGYAWFKTTFIVTKEFEGKKLWMKDNTNSVESLLFIDGKPCGILQK
jgi:alpha-mannosidase